MRFPVETRVRNKVEEAATYQWNVCTRNERSTNVNDDEQLQLQPSERSPARVLPSSITPPPPSTYRLRVPLAHTRPSVRSPHFPFYLASPSTHHLVLCLAFLVISDPSCSCSCSSSPPVPLLPSPLALGVVYLPPDLLLDEFHPPPLPTATSACSSSRRLFLTLSLAHSPTSTPPSPPPQHNKRKRGIRQLT
ncbi:hypothetical protein R3P38DRAFT_3241500 [Favolaschia claudopus]|uniref:Uncharacterized protein n=1 Tax=Favolaschia claudopus TaxID=2862362 RepID=A0AAV9Z5L5_9AGAR